MAALAMALVVALPGTALTLALVSAVSGGGESVVRYVEYASIGITVFIVYLLVHYITGVVRAPGTETRIAVTITLIAFLSTGLEAAVTFLGHPAGRRWEVGLPGLTAVQLVLGALGLIVARALLRGGRPEPGARGRSPGIDRRYVRATVLLVLVAGVAVTVSALLGGGALLGLVVLSTTTSFGGGEAYVGVADGFFVAGGHVDSSTFYSQLVPIANALPGPILVKVAAGVGYAAVTPVLGPTAGWVVATAAALAAITTCTAVAAMVMGAYQRAERSPVIRDVGRYILPVICGLLVTTSVSMLNASVDVAAPRVGAPWVGWASLAAVAGMLWLRSRRRPHDIVLIMVSGSLSLGVMMLL